MQLSMGGGLTPEEAVLCGTERSNAARKRPTAVKRAVLRARAARTAAQAAADAAARAGALAAVRAAAADVQHQYEVCPRQAAVSSDMFHMMDVACNMQGPGSPLGDQLWQGSVCHLL